MEKRAADVIRQELGRLLDSDALRRAPSHTRLLRYLVETSLSGDENALRELAIGVHVFRRNPTTFDPKRDPIVRVTTGRLRAWLESHYHRTNGDPAVRITLPRGCYAPVFHAVSVTARKPWDDRARDLVERARYLLLQRNPEQANLALRLAEQAARDAPQSSAAWSTLAACRFQLLGLMAVEPGVTMATLRHEAETALRLDGENAEALALLATMVHWQQFDMRSALSLYERAVRIEPANAMVRARFSASLMYAGRFEEAGAMIMVARTLDPLNLSLRLSEALLHSYARNHEKARRGYDAVLELRPNHCVALLMGAMNELWANGDVERAQDFIERACALMPDNPTGEMCGAMIEAARGHQASACKRMNRTLAKYQNTYVSPIHAAMAFGALRNRDGVMRELRRAYDLHDVLVVEVCVDPFYEWLRTDSQFDSFLRSLGLPGWVGRSAGSPALDSLPGRVQNEKG